MQTYGGPASAHGLRRVYLDFLYATLPLSDRVDASPDLLLAYIDHALFLRRNVDWCHNLDEWMFRAYVLYPRVNSEALTDCRALFYRVLWDRVKGLDDRSAVLETNRWCHETASYQAQDDRTASPLTVYRCGSGRCGEESVFLVSALRSLGIPARQVYAPFWSHCDDNHAWVEVFCGGAWRFLGACEPEPALDRGWFRCAAARAMLVRSLRFSEGDPGADAIARDGCAVYENETSRYARTKEYRVAVLDENGCPAEGARVAFETLNGARFCPSAVLYADTRGNVLLRAGVGDWHIEASLDGKTAETFLSGGQASCILRLSVPQPADSEWKPFDFHAPPDIPDGSTPLPREARRERRAVLQRGSELRERRIAAFFDERRAREFPGMEKYFRLARGNFDAVYAFLKRDASPLRGMLLAVLSEKDFRDLDADVLEDSIRYAAPFAARYPAEVFAPYVLCPRIAEETITPYREALLSAPGLCEDTDPATLWDKIRREVAIESSEVYAPLFMSPAGVWKEKRADERSRDNLFVAACRSMGVPARLNPWDRSPEYWKNGSFHRADGALTEEITFVEESPGGMIYGHNWAVSRRAAEGWQALYGLQAGTACRLALGDYRAITSLRLPDGDQRAFEMQFSVREGATRKIPLRLRRDCGAATQLTRWPLPAFRAYTADGRETPGYQPEPDRAGLLFWLDEGTEPTAHVLNELSASRDRLSHLPITVTFFLRDPESASERQIARLMEEWPSARLRFGDWEDTLEMMARRLYRDPDSPPLSVACDNAGRAVFACSGYHVGIVDLLIRSAEAALNDHLT